MGKRSGKSKAGNEVDSSEFFRKCDSTVNAMFNKSEELKEETYYDDFKSDFEALLENNFKNVVVHLFGSRLIGLANKNSSLDIFVEIGKLLNLTFEVP